MGICLTQNQKTAIQTLDRDVCVSAGAGSGKTGVLVERYVHIVLETKYQRLPPHLQATPDRILVITFTDKATREMKNRIIKRFRDLKLTEERRQIETAYVSTIHGFCARLLQENPFEAAVDPQFQVLDEIQSARLLRQIGERTLDRLVQENNVDVQELLMAAQMERHHHPHSPDPTTALASSLETILAKLRHAGYTMEDLQKACQEGVSGISKRNSTLVQAFLLPLHAELSACQSALNALIQGMTGTASSSFASILETLNELFPLLQEPLDLLPKLSALGQQLKKTRRTAETHPKASSLASLMYRLQQVCQQAQQLYKCTKEAEELSAKHGHCFLSLLVSVWQEYEREKTQHGSLDMEDLQTRAIALLQNHPYVRHRYQNHFRHLLLDEFQDTNTLQMRIVELLHKENQTACNVLFVVGDVLQSIYGFRNAEPQLFLHVVQQLKKADQGHHIALADNFRSRPEILGLVNQVFQKLWEHNELFIPLASAASFDDKTVPSIEIMLSNSLHRDEYLLKEAEAIAKRIREMVENKDIALTAHSDPRHGEPLQWRDVAVLFRGLTRVALYEEAFARQGVPFYVVGGGRGYYARREVRDLLQTLIYITSPFDDMALLTSLRSPFVGLRLDPILKLFQLSEETKSRSLHALLPQLLNAETLTSEERQRLLRFVNITEALRAQQDRMPPGQILERLITQTNYDICLLVRTAGRRRLANMRKLLQMAYADTRPGLEPFIRRLQETEKLSPREGDAPTEEEESDVVRFLTIHGAKGLEFPVVFLADMSHPIRHQLQELFVCDPKRLALGTCILGKPDLAYATIESQRLQSEAEEAVRLLYVAMTRAREHLVLCGNLDGHRTPEGAPSHWANLLFERLGVNRADSQPKIRPLIGGGQARVASLHAYAMEDAQQSGEEGWRFQEKRLHALAQQLLAELPQVE